MSARLDAIGNVVGRYEGDASGAPCLMLGSHLDTVRNAGKYDGMLGVVAAIDCVHTLHARGTRLPFAIEVVGFADEEGVRFGATLLGQPRDRRHVRSEAAGQPRRRRHVDARRADGIRARSRSASASAARRRADVLAYAELHIEQGPVLEAEGLPVGVVTAINGANRFTVDIEGFAGHAGTVPMELRRDALAAAAECVLAIESRCAREPDLVGTVGRIEAAPGATNVIPGHARFTIDVRAPRDDQRAQAAADIETAITAICARRNVKVDIRRTHEGRTAACAPWLQDQIGRAIEAEGLPVRRLPSGAGHDGMAIVDLVAIGMLFVRCERGISHNPLEAITVGGRRAVRAGLPALHRAFPTRRLEAKRCRSRPPARSRTISRDSATTRRDSSRSW